MIRQILKRILGLFKSEHLTELNLNLSAEEASERAHRCYEDGNFKEAFKYFNLAADQRDPLAQYNLGIMYSEGQGIPQDSVEAERYFKLAADQGYAGK